MTWIGLDLGERRVGVARSDADGIFAQPYATIELSRSETVPLDRVLEIIDETEATGVVIGLPRHLNGSLGPAAESAQRFAELLRSRLAVEVVLWDERLSSVQAERLLIDAGVRRKKRKAITDRVAAALVLQSFLDSRPSADAERREEAT